MEFLDAKTIFVLTGLFSALISVVFFSIHRGVYGVIDGVRSFAWAYALFTLFALLFLLRGLLHPLLTVVAADLALSVALLMIADGVCRIKHYQLHPGVYRWYLSLCLIVFSWYTFVEPNFTARVLANIVSIILVFSWVQLLLFRQPVQHWRLGEWILSVALLISIFAALTRAVLIFADVDANTSSSILGYGGAQANYLTINLLATVFIAFGLIVITQDDLRRDLEQLASYDVLTGVLTRRVILSLMDKTIANVKRHGRPMALLMIDLDHFKRINDNFGHRVGDKVLAEVIHAVESALRKDTYLGRYGGEEFLIVMPETNYQQLLEVSERIRRVAAKTRVAYQDQSIHCTISIGALIIEASNVARIQDPLTLVDKALYQAKLQGRNQVVITDLETTANNVITESTL